MTILRCIAILLALVAAPELRAQEPAGSDGAATAESASPNALFATEPADSPDSLGGNRPDVAHVANNSVTVRFAGPKGVTIGWEAIDGKAHVWAENQLAVPNQFDFEAGHTYRLKVDLPVDGPAALYALLHIYPEAVELLGEQPLVFEVNRLLTHALQNGEFRQLIYLNRTRNASSQQFMLVDYQHGVSLRRALEMIEDPGSVIAVISVGRYNNHGLPSVAGDTKLPPRGIAPHTFALEDPDGIAAPTLSDVFRPVITGDFGNGRRVIEPSAGLSESTPFDNELEASESPAEPARLSSIEAEIRVQRGTDYKIFRQLVEDLERLGVGRFKFDPRPGDSNKVTIIVPPDTSLATMRSLKDHFVTQDQFEVAIWAIDNAASETSAEQPPPDRLLWESPITGRSPSQPSTTDAAPATKRTMPQPVPTLEREILAGSGGRDNEPAIMIELPEDEELADAIRKIADAISKQRPTHVVKAGHVQPQNPDLVAVEIRVHRDTDYEVVQNLIEDLQKLGVARFSLSARTDGRDAVSVAVSRATPGKTVRALRDYFSKQDQFEFNVLVMKDSPAMTGQHSSQEKPLAAAPTGLGGQAAADPAQVGIFTLQYVSADAAARIVEQLYIENPTRPDSTMARLAINDRTNSLIVRGDSVTIAEIEALLLNLDSPEPADAGESRRVPQGTPAEEARLQAIREQYGSATGERRPSDLGPVPLGFDFAVPALGPNNAAGSDNDERVFSFYMGFERDSSVEAFRRKYSELESQAQTFARQLQNLRTKADVAPGEEETLRSNLRLSIEQSFHTRQKLQRAELAEFAQRLQRIQQSIEIRDRIADRIIERRIEELLDPNLRWDDLEPAQTKTSPESATTPPQRPAGQRAADSSRSSNAAQFQNAVPTVQPPALRILLKSARDCLFEYFYQQRWHSVGRDLAWPARLRLGLGESRTIRIWDISGEHRLAITAEIQATQPALEEPTWNGQYGFELRLTDEDFNRLGKGDTVTKVAYLHSGGQISLIDSTRLAADLDPVEEAGRYGTVIAVATFTGARDEVTTIRSVRELVGTWSVVSVRHVTGDGISRRDPRQANSSFLEIGTDRWATYGTKGGMTEWSATFNLDESPQTIVLRASDEQGHPFMQRGLIERSGNTLQTATLFSQRSAPNAPSSFDDPGVTVTTYRRGGEVTSRDDNGRVEISLGVNDGVRPSQQLRVTSEKTPVGTIEVIYVEEQSASARIVQESSERPIEAGDRVDIIPDFSDANLEPDAEETRSGNSRKSDADSGGNTNPPDDSEATSAEPEGTGLQP